MHDGKVIENPGDVTFAKLNIRNKMKFMVTLTSSGGGSYL